MIEYLVEKPDLSKISKKRKRQLNENMFDIYFQNDLWEYSNEKYYFWDKIKFQNLPTDVKSSEELRYVIKQFRIGNITPITDKHGKKFTIGKPNFLEELLHNLDLSLGGHFLGIHFNKTERKTFLQNGIIEEAISSSQLEGALTSSQTAKDMIKKGRKAVGTDEKMILNNYDAMNFINEEDTLSQELSLNKLIELQHKLTKGTLENSSHEGRIRMDDDNIVVQDSIDMKILHTPPNEEVLEQELNKFLKYANDKDDAFTHPFLKATILHFWFGYLHPFCDGNGRTARIIFYWYLLRKGYWGFSYIPISKLIKESKVQYKNAYIYSEQDNNDLTYFLVYIAKQAKLAFKEFENFVEYKRKKQQSSFYNLSYLSLNDRQNKLITYLLENPESYTNNSIHKNYYGIAINTAKKDLEELFTKGFLYKKRQGKYVNYFPSSNFNELIKKPN